MAAAQELSELQTLNVAGQAFSGTLPTQYSFPKLVELDLSNNNIGVCSSSSPACLSYKCDHSVLETALLNNLKEHRGCSPGSSHSMCSFCSHIHLLDLAGVNVLCACCLALPWTTTLKPAVDRRLLPDQAWGRFILPRPLLRCQLLGCHSGDTRVPAEQRLGSASIQHGGVLTHSCSIRRFKCLSSCRKLIHAADREKAALCRGPFRSCGACTRSSKLVNPSVCP